MKLIKWLDTIFQQISLYSCIKLFLKCTASFNIKQINIQVYWRFGNRSIFQNLCGMSKDAYQISLKNEKNGLFVFQCLASKKLIALLKRRIYKATRAIFPYKNFARTIIIYASNPKVYRCRQRIRYKIKTFFAILHPLKQFMGNFM